MDRFLSLQAFLMVAEAKSFSQAARTLGVSKAVVSERVRQLEILVRSPLFHRTTRLVSLSEAGKDLALEARLLVHRLADLENSVPGPNIALAGRLRIASIVDFGISHIGPAVSDFAREHPQLKIELVVSDRVVNPLHEGFDIAIHLRQLNGPGLSAHPLFDVKNSLVASPAYLATAAQLDDAADLATHRCVGYAAQTTTEQWDTNLWVLHDEHDSHEVDVKLSMTTNSGHVLTQFALDGHGIAVLPLERVKPYLADNQLIRILPHLMPETLRLFAVIPESQREQRKVQALLTYLRTRFAS